MGFHRGQCTVTEIILADSINYSDMQHECMRILHRRNPAAHVVILYDETATEEYFCKTHSLIEELSKPTYLYNRLAVSMKCQPDRKMCQSGMLSVFQCRVSSSRWAEASL